MVNGPPLASAKPVPVIGRPARRGVVAAATDLIDAAPERPWTTRELAAQCHVGPRTLQAGFRRTASRPWAIRLVRLQRARAELAASDRTATTVASIAQRWGFAHHGRFARDYAKTFGELPSATLDRA